MKRKNICAEAALREVARKNHTTVEEVRKEIRLAMIAAMCNPDPAIQKRYNRRKTDLESWMLARDFRLLTPLCTFLLSLWPHGMFFHSSIHT